MKAKKSRPFQPLEDSEVSSGVLCFGMGNGGEGFPGSCGIFIGCQVNAFVFGIGVLCGGEGPGLGNSTYLVPRKGQTIKDI